MTDFKIDLEDLVKRTRREMAADVRGSLGNVQGAVLALTPRWTAAMALEMGVDKDEMERLKEAAYVEEIGQHYMPSSAWRAIALAPALEDAGIRRQVLQELKKVAELAPTGLQRWKRLAEQGNTAASARQFEQEVAGVAATTHQLEDTELLDARANEILGWIEAARPFQPLARADRAPALEVGIDRAQRTVNLIRRRARDFDYLRSYVTRADQDDAIRSLVDADPTDWCLHVVGPGGSGKTMLVRHVVAKLARDLPSARVDFDLLSPDYPFKDPGVLFETIATELAVWATDDGEKGLDSARGLLEILRVELKSVPDRDPLESPTFARILDVFREFFQRIAGGRPLILILDTCEELSKYRIDDRPSPALAKTFAILERLRYGRELTDDERAEPAREPSPIFPELRVLLAGRRLLASRGRNYRADASPQPARGYLRLHEVRGFTDAEAWQFLRNMRVDRSYHTAILDATPEISDGINVAWDVPQPPGTDERRHHPYDLYDMAMLVTAPEPPAPEEIRKLSDPKRYVDVRILRRLDCPALLRALPAITRLGHIDAALLSLIVPAAEIAEVQRVFSEQDWVIAEPWGEGHAYSIDSKMLARLDTYYAGAWLPEAALRAARSHLEERLATGDLGKLDWQPLDAALRLRADKKLADMWPWWLSVEQRLLRERGARWTADVMDRLLARGLPAGRAPGCLVAATLAHATLACASLDRGTRTHEMTFELRRCERHINPGAIVPALEARIAALELETALSPLGSLYAIKLADWASQDVELDATTRYALRAAYLALLDDAERGNVRALSLAQPAGALFPAGEGDDPDLAAIGALIRGRIAAFVGRARDGEAELLELARAEIGGRCERPHGKFAEIDLRTAVDIEVGRWVRDWGGELETWIDSVVPRVVESAEATLQSLVIAGRLALSSIELHTTFKPLTRTSVLTSGARQLPSLLVRIAEFSSARGLIDKAVEQFDLALEDPEEQTLEPARAHIRFVHAYRLWEAGVHPSTLLRSSKDPVDARLVAALDVMQGVIAASTSVPPVPEPAWIHAEWRSLRAFGAKECEAATAWWLRHGATLAPRDPLWAAVIGLDAVEHAEMTPPRASPPRELPELPALPCASAVDWAAVALRMLPLQPPLEPTARAFLHDAERRLGARRLAEVALDEAEMLALRLPKHARVLFEQATTWFRAAEDRVGEARSLIAAALLGRAGRLPEMELELPHAADSPGLIRPLLHRREIAGWLGGAWDAVLLSTEDVDMRPSCGPADLRAAREMALAAQHPVVEAVIDVLIEDVVRLRIRPAERSIGTARSEKPQAVSVEYGTGAQWAGSFVTDVWWSGERNTYRGPPLDVLAGHDRTIKTIELDITDELLATDWEHWLADLLNRFPRVRRVAARVMGSRAHRSPPDLEHTLIAASAVVEWLQAYEHTFISRDPRRARNARLVHLAGTAREDFRSYDATVVTLDEPWSSKRGSVISATMLRRILHDTPLFLLHATPWKEGISKRAAAEQAAAARRFAGELASESAAVVVVPSLAVGQSRDVVRALIERLLSARHAVDLVEAVAMLRAGIHEFAEAAVALDACLYAPGDWKAAPPLAHPADTQ